MASNVRHLRDDATRGLTSCVYLMWSETRGQFKVGEASDIGKRLAGHRTACPDIELVGAVQHPSAGAIEQRLLAHFKDARVGVSEWLVPSQAVSNWAERFRRRPNVATSITEVVNSFPLPDLWPWSDPDVLLDADGQLGLPVFPTPYKPPVGSGNGQTSAISEDWYTPAPYIEAVRELYGGTIDLDPASCAEANLVVRAESIYTAEVDGLRHRWFGNVYLNPPWGRTGLAKRAFVKKALSSFGAGEITAAVLALNSNAMTSAWFDPLLAHPVCIPNHRVPHYGPGGAGGAPNSGTVFVYLGKDVERFADVFTRFGTVVTPLRRASESSRELAEDYEEEAA